MLTILSCMYQILFCVLQLKCRSCNDLNCKAGACTDGFGCSACPVGYGISMREPPFACTLPCPSNCVDCDAGRALWPSENVRCNACAQVRTCDCMCLRLVSICTAATYADPFSRA